MPGPRIAISTGDPAGIGPEIVLKAAHALQGRLEAGALSLIVLGSAASHRAVAADLAVSDPFRHVTFAEAARSSAPLSFVDVAASDDRVPVGRSTALGGQIAYDAIERAVRLALDGVAGAICTGPISKEALNLAGHHYSGHTELLADLTKARDSVMLLVHGDMRVSHMTTHTALQDVPGKITAQRLRRVVSLTDDALKALGAGRRKIAVAALNPHAGEGGLFGRQDIDVVEPAIANLKGESFDVEGPVPGDTVFVKLRARQYDAVVAMYHDQGHIPVKLLGFSVDAATGKWNALSGVNVTLGLPIIRTSVDHGTAFDIAGTGLASETSLVEAIDLAITLAAAQQRDAQA